MRNLLPLAALVPLVVCNRIALSSLPPGRILERDKDQRRELLYLPSGKSLEMLSFGYKNALADYLWFHAISYFGKHINTDRNLPWLYHFCDLVTTLNPRALHVYEFGSTMLSWELEQSEQSVQLLTKAISHFPHNWKLFYLRGFTYMYFLKRPEEAKRDFVHAATLPDVPSFVVTLAAKQALQVDQPEDVIPLLQSHLAQVREKEGRAHLEKRLNEAFIKRDIKVLRMGVDIYREKFGGFPRSLGELFEKNIVQGELRPPAGGVYALDPRTGEVGFVKGVER